MSRRINIIYEDEYVVVCDKKAGDAVQSKSIARMDMESMLKQYLFRKTGKRDMFVSPVHRLDQPVEGIIIFAKNSKVAGELSRQIQTHSADKYYLAVVQGHFHQTEGMLVDYLKKEPMGNYSYVADKNEEGSKEARLEYKVMEEGEDAQLVEVHLMTGRHHQIRVQLSHAGHPILGDSKYNGKDSADSTKGEIALCAYRLAFTHPVTKKRMEFIKKPDGEFFQKFTYIEGIGTY